MNKYAIALKSDFDLASNETNDFYYEESDNEFVYYMEATDKEEAAKEFLKSYYMHFCINPNFMIPEYLRDVETEIMKFFIEFGDNYLDRLESFENSNQILKLQEIVSDELLDCLILNGQTKIKYEPNGSVSYGIPSNCDKYVAEVLLNHPAKELFDLLSVDECAELFYYLYSSKVYVITLSDMDELA